MCIALHSFCEPRIKDVSGQHCLKTWHETHWDIAWACSNWRAWLENSFTWLISGHEWKQGAWVTFHMCSWWSFPHGIWFFYRKHSKGTQQKSPSRLVWEVIKGVSWLNLKSIGKVYRVAHRSLKELCRRLGTAYVTPSVGRAHCWRISSRNAWS